MSILDHHRFVSGSLQGRRKFYEISVVGQFPIKASDHPGVIAS
ncbi:MAG: hypothetical protein ABR920_12395 [Terriglobales bacterium]